MTKYDFSTLISFPTDTSHLLKVEGAENTKELLKKFLTVRNSSVGFRIKKISGNLKFWRERGFAETALHGAADDKTIERIAALEGQLKELIPEYKHEYYVEKDGNLYIPSGLWDVVPRSRDFHLNTEIEPYFLEQLRDYQREAVAEILKYKRDICVMATGLGKTLVIASLVKTFINAGKRVFVAVPTEYLVGQIEKTLKTVCDSITSAGGGRKPKLGTDVFVCTAHSADKYVGPYDTVIIDEVQHLSASTWEKMILAADQAEYVYGFTATAFRTDGLDLGLKAWGGPVVFERDVRWGIKHEWLTPPKIYSIVLTPRKMDGSQVIVSDRCMTPKAYKILISRPYVLKYVKRQVLQAVSKGKKCIVLFKTLPPAEMFSEMLPVELGVKVANANFKKPLNDFRDGKCPVLLATDRLVSEGVDIPNADVLILLTQTSSDLITYQAMGRVLRKSDGKDVAIIIDIGVRGYKQFDGARQKRLTVYKSITNDIVMMDDWKE